MKHEAQRAPFRNAGTFLAPAIPLKGVLAENLTKAQGLSPHKHHAPLQGIQPFSRPKVELEQYPTGAEIASRMLFTVGWPSLQ